MSRDEWKLEVDDMVARGAEGSEQEIRTVIDYLAKNLAGRGGSRPIQRTRIYVNRASAQQLQAALGISLGEAQEIVRYRETHGFFNSFEALSKAPGVDVGKIGLNRDRLSFAEQ